ncbi:hypothetical protein AB0M38_16645 [Streptomyces sp. NPDC051742]|uniref:hypothetical protein n=1 Tax=unclassified Streptomyces TaxID=2593676 RepID=UPI003411FD2F
MAEKKWTWEEGLKVFMDTTGALTTRETVAGPGSMDWSDFGTFRIEKNVAFSKDYSKIFDFYWTFDTSYGGQSARFVVGFSANWKGYFDDVKSPYNLFLNEPYKALLPLVNGTSSAKTDIVNSFSFGNAKDQLDGVVTWLDEWLPLIKGWGNDMDSEGSEWRGSAAGAFKKFVDVIHMEMNKVKLDIKTPQDISKLLGESKTQLETSSWGMYRAFEAWRAKKVPPDSETGYSAMNGVALLRAEFNRLMTGSTLTVTWRTTGTPSYGNGYTSTTTPDFGQILDGFKNDVSSPDWVRTVERNAKNEWLKTIADLDTAASTHVLALDNSYLKLAAALEEGVYQPSFTLPGGGGPTGPGGAGGGGGPGTEDLPGGGSGGPGGIGGGGGGSGLPDLKGGKGGGSGNPGDKKPTGLPDGPRIPPVSVPTTTPGSPGGGPGTGTGGGGKVPLLDKNGKPVMGSDGNPVLVPPGSRIGKDGKVYDANGKPVLGTGGKQIVAPPGGKVGTPPVKDETQTGGLPGSNYDRIRLPEGAKVLADGTVVDAKGKQLLDSNGNPYALPKGATLKDGIVVDANGNPISRMHQLLTNAEHAVDSPPVRKITTGGGGSGGDNKLILDGYGSRGGGNRFTLDGGGSGGSGDGPRLKGGSSVVTGTGGLGERAARMLGIPPEGPPLTATATPDGRQSGGGTGSGGTGGGGTGSGGAQMPQSPMMPPMSPGAGAGAGGPNQGNDRQRTTWLTEDEETWGTDTGSVSGVIGR